MFETLASIGDEEQERSDFVALDTVIVRCRGDRWSDAVEWYRVVERTPERVRVCGKVFDVEEQGLHPFWLDVVRDGARTHWTLRIDVDPTSMTARRASHVLDLIRDPTEVVWLVTLEGSE
jgi:hypothetical protein